MRPEFGCRIHDHVFAPANAATAGQIAYDVRQALERWEPRIDVLDVGVSFDEMETGTLYVDIRYEIRGLNDPRNLVFPFYVIPEHEPSARGQPGTDGPSQGPAPAPSPGRLLAEVVGPMLPAPNLDDRHFQDLVDDAKRLVQQRCPTWTDHNVSDPGVTLIEAFAQMVDQLIYRLNRVPDLHYVKFLELIGVELRPPAAARGEAHLLAVRAAAAAGDRPGRDPGRPPRAPTSTSRWSSAPPGELEIIPCRFEHRRRPDRRQRADRPHRGRSATAASAASPAAPQVGRRAADRAVRRRAVVRGAAADGLHGVRRGVDPRRPAAGLGGLTGDRGWQPARSTATRPAG